MFVKYPDTEQFRHVVSDVIRKVAYDNISRPTIPFTGKVKLHGTNAGIGLTIKDGKPVAWLQGRNKEIPKGNQYFGMGDWFYANYESILEYMLVLSAAVPLMSEGDYMMIHGEWAGEGVQKKVGISRLPKAFYIFDSMYNIDGVEVWSPTDLEYTIGIYDTDASGISNILYYPKFVEPIWIDFNKLEEAEYELTRLTELVSKDCPISKHLGKEGPGEGWVWTGYWGDIRLRFKTKGEDHKVTKEEKLVSSSAVDLVSVYKFIDYAVTESRMNQAITEIGKTPDTVTVRDIKQVIDWVRMDIVKEESDVLQQNGLTIDQVSGKIGNKVAMYVKSLGGN